MQQGACKKGYTLVEILIVVTILGVVALVAIPNFSSNTQKLDLAVAEVVQAIRFARSESMRTGELHGFFVGVPQPQISVFRADTDTIPPTPIYDVYHPISKKLYNIDLDTHRFAAGDIVFGALNYQGICVDPRYTIFDAQGTAYCGNPFPITMRQGSLTFSLGNHSRVVTLYGVTGKVAVQ